MQFQDDLAGGIVLVRPALQSPDYAPRTAGWTINQDGSAEFNDVIIRGSTTVGGDQFWYNGAPAAGNMIFSLSGAGGTDEFGNVYPAGFASYQTDALGVHYITALTEQYIQLRRVGQAGPGGMAYAYDGFGQYTLQLSSGADAGPNEAVIDLISESAVGANDSALNLGADRITLGGLVTADNRITGRTSITPTAANTPTSKVITFPTPLTGSSFTCQVSAETAVPGTTVTGVGYNNLSSTGVTLWLARTNTTATNLSYTVEGV